MSKLKAKKAAKSKRMPSRSILSSKMLKHSRFSKANLAVFVLIFAAIGGYLLFSSYATSNMTGASQGICSPSPCTQGTLPNSTTNEVTLGTVFNDWANENYIYHYYVPHGLACTGSTDCSAADPNHKPAAVFLASGSGGYPNDASGTAALTDSGWQHVADANQLVIIVLDWPTNCVSQVINSSGVITTPGTEITCGGWQRPKTTCDMYVGTAPNYVRWNYNIDGAGAGGTVAPGKIICDSSANNAADESSSVPYVVALVNAAVSRFALNPSRLYFTGASSGGAMTRELMCDSRSSNLFRGYAIISNGTNSTPNGTTGSCPNSANRNFFVQYVSGTNGNQDPYNTGNIPGSCVVGASGVGSDPCTHEQMGFTDSRNWTASYFGCGSPTITGTPGSLTTNVIYDYHTGCVYGLSPQVEFISVGNGGHTWPCLDAVPQVACAGSSTNPTNGFNTAQSNWAFFAGTTTNVGGGDTTPPSTPTNLTETGSTGTSISLSWTASTDNVGVTGYDLYENGSSTGTTASTSATFSGLTCGTSYTLAVDAFDAAGNKSGQASGSFSTGACADTTPPTVSMTAPTSGATVSGITVTVSANAADNVGV